MNCKHSSECKRYWLKKCHGSCPNPHESVLSAFLTAYAKAKVRLKEPLGKKR